MTTIVRNQPFHALADHDGIETSTYEFLVDGVVVASQPVATLQGGTVTFSNILSTTLGPHAYAVRAVGPNGAASSVSVSIDTVPGVPVGPTAPTNFRVIVA